MSTKRDRDRLSRRQILQGAGSLLAAAAVSPTGESAAALEQSNAAVAGTRRDAPGAVARYMVETRDRALPPEVEQAAKHRILDTMAAIVSGARLKPGKMAREYVASQGGVPEATVCASRVKTSAVNAAWANAMSAHADETDDVEPVTKTHPGCAVVPAALAVGERENASGAELLKAVTLGYDLC